MVRIESRKRPFDVFHILSSKLENSGINLDEDNIAALVSNAALLDTTSEMGQEQQTQFSNIKAGLFTTFEHPKTKNKHLKAYSSFGIRGVHYPSKKIKELCTLLYALNLVSEFLKCDEDTCNVVDVIKNDIISTNKLGMNIQEIVSELDSNSVVNVDLAEYLKDASSKVTESLMKWKKESLISIHNQASNRKEFEELIIQKMQHQFTEILDDPQKGLEVAILVVDSVALHISNQKNLVKKRMVEVQKELESFDEDSKLIVTELTNLISGSIVLFKQKRIERNIDQYSLLCKDMYDKKREEKLLQEVRTLLTNVQKSLNKIKDAQIDLKRKFEIVTDSLSRKKQECEHNLLSGQDNHGNDLFEVIGNSIDEVDYHYQQFENSVSKVHQSICLDGIRHWLDCNSDTIYNEIHSSSLEQFKTLQFDIKHVIQNLDVMIRQLYDNTYIAMKFTGQEHGFSHNRLPTFCFIGVPEQLKDDCEASVKKLPTRDIQVVPMKESDKIVMVVYKYCIPLMAMKPITDLVKKYNQKINGEIPLHIFNIKDLPEIC